MAGDPLKLDATSELRDLTAQASKVFDQINIWLVKNQRYGYLPDAPNTPPLDPVIDADFAESAHAGVTAEQFYATATFFAGLVQSVNPQTARLLARFGKAMSQQ